MKSPKLKYNDIVEITWLDAVSDSGWRDEDKIKKEKVAVCKSLGFYVKHDKVAFIISPDVNDLKDRSSTLIPLGMIQKIRKLK